MAAGGVRGRRPKDADERGFRLCIRELKRISVGPNPRGESIFTPMIAVCFGLRLKGGGAGRPGGEGATPDAVRGGEGGEVPLTECASVMITV